MNSLIPNPLSIASQFVEGFANYVEAPDPHEMKSVVFKRLGVINMVMPNTYQAFDAVEVKDSKAPVYMGHGFYNDYDALINPAPISDFSQDFTRHMLSQAVEPETLIKADQINPAPILSVVSDLPSGNAILDEEVRPIQDAQVDRILDTSALSNTVLTDTVSINPVVADNVVDLSSHRRVYPSGLDADAISQAASESALTGDEARAYLAKAA
jgi:hypothetical protein